MEHWFISSSKNLIKFIFSLLLPNTPILYNQYINEIIMKIDWVDFILLDGYVYNVYWWGVSMGTYVLSVGNKQPIHMEIINAANDVVISGQLNTYRVFTGQLAY